MQVKAASAGTGTPQPARQSVSQRQELHDLNIARNQCSTSKNTVLWEKHLSTGEPVSASKPRPTGALKSAQLQPFEMEGEPCNKENAPPANRSFQRSQTPRRSTPGPSTRKSHFTSEPSATATAEQSIDSPKEVDDAEPPVAVAAATLDIASTTAVTIAFSPPAPDSFRSPGLSGARTGPRDTAARRSTAKPRSTPSTDNSSAGASAAGDNKASTSIAVTMTLSPAAPPAPADSPTAPTAVAFTVVSPAVASVVTMAVVSPAPDPTLALAAIMNKMAEFAYGSAINNKDAQAQAQRQRQEERKEAEAKREEERRESRKETAALEERHRKDAEARDERHRKAAEAREERHRTEAAAQRTEDRDRELKTEARHAELITGQGDRVCSKLDSEFTSVSEEAQAHHQQANDTANANHQQASTLALQLHQEMMAALLRQETRAAAIPAPATAAPATPAPPSRRAPPRPRSELSGISQQQQELNLGMRHLGRGGTSGTRPSTASTFRRARSQQRKK